MHITLRSREYVIEKRLPDGTIRIKDIITDERTAMPEQELIDALFEKGAELLGHNRSQDVLKERLAKTGVCDIATLKEDDPRKIELQRRLSYVEAVDAARLDKRTEETLKPIIERVASLIADRNGPSTETLSRWLGFYDKSGRDARALVPATKARGNRKRRFLGRRAKKGDLKNNPKAQERASRVADLIDNAIDEVYLKDQRFTVAAVHDALTVKIDDANRSRDISDHLPLPDKSSLYDLVNKLEDYDVIEARYGKKIADEKYRTILLGARPTRPLERVECDHTTTDLFVVDPVRMLPIGRAFLTWMICVYTKMILGFYISFNPPSYLTVMECLKHAIRPKTYVRRKYPNVRNDWKAYGIPEVLVVDNAREFHGRNLEDACHQLGIVLQFSPRGKPWIRGTVERSYRTVATQLHHQLPGTTFSNIFERADYEPGKTAIVTPDTLNEITHKWIADIYQVSAHRGIRDVPSLRWEHGIAEWPGRCQ
jgi:putative transposase